jgi:TP901 family phage tail tape measure protein
MANINAQFNYSANFGPVIGQMQKLSAEANILNNTLQNLDKQAVGLKGSLASSFASDLGKIGGWNAKMVEMTDSVDNFGQSLLKQKLTLKQYAKEAVGAFTESSNAHKLAIREVSRGMSQLVSLGKGMDGKQMGMMITPATINLKDFNTQLAVNRKQWSIFNSLVQDGTTHLINFGKNTQWAGRQITVGLTVPLTIYGNMVSKIFREVDAELTRFQKVYGADLGSTSEKVSNQMVSDVRSIAVEFSKSFGIAAKDTASLAADLAATGLEGQKLLGALRETTRLAVLGDTSNQDAMKTTLSLQNAFKMSTDELAQSVNFLNAVENQTSLSLQDLTTAIPKAGPVVKALGGDVKDLALLMVALKEGGISAGEGANALKSGMASLINPTKQASLTAKQYGIDIEAIVQANRGQLLPTIMEFQKQLQLLDEFGKAQLIEQIFGKYQFARMSALFDNLNANASQTNAVLGLMGKSNRELAATAYQEMETLMNSASKRFERAIEGIKSQFLTIGQSITTSITPILENVTGKIGKAIEFFQNLPKPIKSFIKVATGLTAIAGPVIMMVGIFSNFMGYVAKGAMGVFNLGRRMAGIPVEKFEMLTDTQLMAQKATQELARSFDVERSSVEKLNIALGLYKRNLADAISLNPAFLNRQVAAATKPQAISGTDMPPPPAKLQRGGSAWVPGSGDGDKVPAMLEPGEYVVNKKAAAQNSALLDDINFRQAPRFQMGGRMPGYADTSYLPYESVLGMDKKAEPFIGPLPQISYTLQGGYRPGGYTPMLGYPFSSKESAESFQSTRRDYQGSGSRITRDINDPQQKAYADWIEGHNSNQFRTGTGVMKRMDMEGHRDQMLKSMGPISQSIPLYRGTVLKEKGANEFSGVGARELLMYIQNGMFEKAIGKKIQWSDMQSFSSNPNIASYNKFIESWTNPSNTNSKKAADRQLQSMSMLPIIFRLASAKGQNGFNISDKAMVQEVMGKPVNEQEWVLNNPSGTITGIRQDMGTKNYIVDLMQNGGRVQSHADESFRAPFQKTDKEYETVYKWIGGELDYFRRRKNVKGRWTDSEKFDAERYKQLLSIMRSVPEGTKMMRGSILNPGMSGEMSKEAQLAMLTAIQTGDYGSLYGMEVSFNDFASFASNFMGEQYGPRGVKGVSEFSRIAYNKLYRGVHNKDTESSRFFDKIERDRATGKESKYGSSPVMYDFTAGPNTQGRDISMGDPSTGAPYPKYRDSWVKEVPDGINEILTYGAQGTITGVSSDIQSRQPIIHMQGKQMGGRVNGYADKSRVFAHIVPGKNLGSNINLKYPLGFDIPGDMNQKLRPVKIKGSQSDSVTNVKKKDFLEEISKPVALQTMTKLFRSFSKKHPQSDIKSGYENTIKESTIKALSDAPKMINDPIVYNESLKEDPIKKAFNAFKRAEFISDYRANISPTTLIEAGFTEGKGGIFTSKEGDLKVKVVKRGDRTKIVDPRTGRSIVSPSQKQTSFPWHNPLLGYLANKKQSGGRINGYATETASWAKKAAAPKAYAGVLQNIPNWATKPNEYQAIVEALRAAGIPESDRLASFYIQDVLAHINPSTTNANGVYEKVWAAANLMKDSQVYNVFLETLKTRKDIGGLLNPSTVSRVAAASGLPMSLVQTELTKLADGVHPKTANGAKVMMTLARMFPSRTSPGMPIAVAAGMGARLQGNFYDTLAQRSLPSNLPNITVRSYDPKGDAVPTSSTQGSKVSSSGIVMPSGAIKPSMVMPNIQSLNSNAGGTGSKATVKVDAMGNVLSNSIDDMVVSTVNGETIAVSSRELLAIGPNGGIAGVTSPGDEARGNIIHPVGTALMRGKKYEQNRLKGFAENSMAISGLDFVPENPQAKAQVTEPVYDENIVPGSMNKFGGRMMMMVGALDQMRFAMNQFTSETSNGTSKFVAGMNLALTGTQMIGQETGQRLMEKGALMSQGSGGPMSRGMGRAMSGLGKAANLLGNPAMQMGLQVGIMAVNKAIEIYQAEMVKARLAGNGAFKEPIETAKLLGVELKSLTVDAEKYAKFAENLFGSQGRGAYDKVFAEAVKKDYGDFLDILGKSETKQEQINQLMNAYGNLIQRGMDPKVAYELTAEIARQGKAMTAFNEASQKFTSKNTVEDAMVMQTESLESQINILQDRANTFGVVGQWNGQTAGFSGSELQQSRAINEKTMFEALGATGDGVVDKALRGFFGTKGAGGWLGTGAFMTSLIAPFLIDAKTKEQIASQIGAALKGAFAIAAQNPVASNEAVDAIVAQFKNADTGKIQEEIGKLAEEFGFGELSNIGMFIDDGAFSNLTLDTEDGSLTEEQARIKGEKTQALFLNALKSGLGPMLDQMLADGDLSDLEEKALRQKVLEAQAIMKIDAEIDLQLDETTKQLQTVQDELNKVFDIALRGKQEEIDAENKRHAAALKNLDKESQRINDKKDLLKENTDYYIKELEREKDAEDYYENQRQTSLQGLSAISKGDVFGFIGAQMKAASDSDQFGRDRSLAAIQETADAEQDKLDKALKAIDLRRQAENERHEAELDNINKEIEALNKKKASTAKDLQEAIKLLEEASKMQPSASPEENKIYNEKIAKAYQLAGSAIDQAKAAAGFVDKTGLSPDLQKEMDEAQKKTGEALDTFYKDTDTAMQYIANGGEGGWDIVLEGMSDASRKIFEDVAESLDIDANTQEFISAANFLGRALNSGTGETGAKNRLSLDSSNFREDRAGIVRDPFTAPPLGQMPAPQPKRTPPKAPVDESNAFYQDANGFWWKRNNGKWASGNGLSNPPSGFTSYKWGSWKTKAAGGYISGPGTATSDSIPALLSNGEFVINAAAVKAYGPELMDKINTKKFADGGPVGDYSRVSYRGKTFNARTARMLQAAERNYGSGFGIYQGSYSTNVKASMGTHNGGGAVDIKPPADINKALSALSLAGFWAKWRGGMKPPHIHALAIGDKELSNPARRQLGLPPDKSYSGKQSPSAAKDPVESYVPLTASSNLSDQPAVDENSTDIIPTMDAISKISQMFQMGPSPSGFALGGLVGNLMNKAPGLGKNYLGYLKTAGSFIANNFLGVDDFSSMYSHMKQGNWKAGFKSLGAGVLELGSTALMLVPGAGQVAMAAKLANIASKSVKVAKVAQGASDVKSGVGVAKDAVDLLKDVRAVQRIKASSKVQKTLNAEKTKKALDAAKKGGALAGKAYTGYEKGDKAYVNASAGYNVVTGQGTESDYATLTKTGAKSGIKKLFKASGGYISGPGSSTSDSIPAMLSNGEYVINASAVREYGPQLMDRINTKRLAAGGMAGSMPSMSSAPGFAAGGGVGTMPKISAPSAPTYSIPSAGGGMDVQPIAQMARGGMMSGSNSDNSSSYNFNFNGAGMDMVMSHVNKAVGGRIGSNSRRIG